MRASLLLCCCPKQSELSRATLETPLYSQEGPDPTPLRTARSSRSTSSAMRASQAQQVREMAAAERHAARLSTSRQSGQYRGSSGGGAATGSAAGSPGGSTLGSMISKGFSKVSNFVHPSGSSTSRSVPCPRGSPLPCWSLVQQLWVHMLVADGVAQLMQSMQAQHTTG